MRPQGPPGRTSILTCTNRKVNKGSMTNSKTMVGAVLPGNSTVELREFPIPEPGYGQVLIKTKSSTICGSDIRAIYREHVGKGPEGYQNKIAGHEPCGQIVKEGPGGTLGLSPRPDMIHDQKTVYGSWVKSIWLMEDLV